jgi:hypothetical protein
VCRDKREVEMVEPEGRLVAVKLVVARSMAESDDYWTSFVLVDSWRWLMIQKQYLTVTC